MVACQHVQRAAAHQSEVGMVEHALHAHRLLHLVESLCREALHQGVSLTRHLHAIHDVVARVALVDHLLQRSQVVLQVSIDGHHGIGPFPCGHHAGHDGVLMTYVTAQVDAFHETVLRVQLLNDFPCAVFRAVVHEHHHAVVADFPFSNHVVEELCQPFHRVFQHLFLIITR